MIANQAVVADTDVAWLPFLLGGEAVGAPKGSATYANKLPNPDSDICWSRAVPSSICNATVDNLDSRPDMPKLCKAAGNSTHVTT